MSNDISNFSISPAINNRSQYNACGVGGTDTLSQFNLGMYTSGQTNTIGFSLQGANGLDINLNPVKTTRLWINELSSEVSFKVKSDEILTLESLTEDIQINGTMTLDKTISIQRKTTIKPESIEVRDTVNDPFGDPIFTQITPNNILMQNGNAAHETSTLTTSSLYIYNDNVGYSSTLDASSITSTNWDIDTTGNPYFNALRNVLVYTIPSPTFDIDLLSSQNLTYSMDMNSKIAGLTFSNGVPNGNYKIYMTGITGEIFYKNSCINNLFGDTVIAVGSFWILTVYYTGSIYVVNCDNYT